MARLSFRQERIGLSVTPQQLRAWANDMETRGPYLKVGDSTLIDIVIGFPYNLILEIRMDQDWLQEVEKRGK